MRICALVISLALWTAASVGGERAQPSWPQWGGPDRNFAVSAPDLSWPSGGPKRLWSRPLGEGHSAVVEDGGRLFTQYRPLGMLSAVRRSQEEVVAAFDAASGKTIWEHRYPAPTSQLNFEHGAGPNATPLVVDGLVFATSSLKQLFALDRDTGRVVWSKDLMREYGAPVEDRGYSCSPLAFGNTVIVTAGGRRDQAAMAFDRRTGALAWKAGDFRPSPASPMLIDVDGHTELVVLGGDRIAGFDPASGAPLWSHPHVTQFGLNISPPVWNGRELLVSSAYNGGTRLIRLRRSDGKTSVEEAWFTSRMRVHFGSVLRFGDHYYGSSGDFGPSFLVALDSKSGQVAWQDRSFARAQLVGVGNTALLLDEDGTLGLVSFSPVGLKTLGRATVMEATSWTPPTVVGTRVYLRDRRNMVAVSLGS